MQRVSGSIAGAVIATAVLGACATVGAPKNDMSFFVSSSGSGRGGDLGRLDGADRQCQTLATVAGAGHRTWRAYLSTQPSGTTRGGHARDRIGTGPWKNAKGVVVAENVDHLHGPANNLNKQTALTEHGATVNGRGDAPNMHDILTGSQPDGRYIAGSVDSTCSNWTHGGPMGAAMVGHHDRMGLDDSVPAKSWNSSHLSRGGCSPEALRGTGGNGLLYCFAAR